MADKTRIKGNLVSDNNLFVNPTTDNTGIGTTNPTSKLHVVGDGLFTGIVTASSFVGNLTGTATNVIGGIGSLSQLQVSGISTLGIVTASNIFSTGIITASQFSTGLNGIGINTNTITGPAVMIIDPAAVGDNTGILRIRGDLYVDGTQTIINSSTLEVADLQIGIGTTAINDIVLDGAGIGIGSLPIRKTFTWEYSTSSFKSSENINLALNKTYEINGTDVLSSTTLGTGVTNSSLTSVGTLTNLNVSGVTTSIGGFVGNLTGTATTANNVIGGIGSLSSLNVSGISSFQNVSIAQSIFDSTGSLGVNQYVLSATPTGVLWQSITGVGGISGINITQSTDNTRFNIPFINIGAGTTAVAYVSPSNLNYNPFTNFVGIGTNTPLSTLEVDGAITIGSTVSTASTSKIRVSSVFRDNGIFEVATRGSNQVFTVDGNTQELFRVNNYTGLTTEAQTIFLINSSGIATFYNSLNVTNTVSLGSTLTVGSSISAGGNISVGNTSADSFSFNTIYNRINSRAPFSTSNYISITPKVLDNGSLSFQAPVGIAFTNREAQVFSISNNFSSSIFTVNDLNFNPILEATATGRIGIGTTNPSTRLEVVGGTKVVSSGSTLGEQITINHYRNIAVQPTLGITTNNRGAISFDSPSGISADGINLFPASLFAITNDPTGNVLSVAGYTWYSGSREPAIDVTQSSRVGIGITNPRQKFDIVGNTIIDGNVGIGTTTTSQKLEVVGTTRVTSIGAATNQQIDLIHIKPGTTGISSTSGIPARGSLVFGGTWDINGNTATSAIGGQLVTILNDNTSLFSINQQIGFSTFNPPPTGTRFIESVLEVTGSGNIGIGTTLPVHRFEINSRNHFVSSVVAFASTIGISTTLITGINTTGIVTGLEIQGFTGVIASGTTVTSIGSSQIGIGRTTLNDFIRNNTPLTFGNRVNNRVVGVTSEGFVGIRTTNPRVALDVIGDASISGVTTVGLASTSSPSVNSTMSFELTDNTTLTVRVRGADGVVRTGIVSLT